MFFNHLPEPSGIRVRGNSLEDNTGCAVTEWPVHDIGMARNPADIGGAPEDILFVVIENELVGYGHKNEITARSVQYPLGLSC